MDDKTEPLKKQLTQIRRAGEERAAARLAHERGLLYIDLRKTPVEIEAVRLVPESEAKEAKLIGLQVRLREVAVAVANPSTPLAERTIKSLEDTGYKVKIFIASLSGISEAWHLYQFVAEEPKEITGKIEISAQRLKELSRRLTTLEAVSQEIGKIGFERLATTELFEVVLSGALANRASDIHFEAEKDGARLRFRVDGVLHDISDSIPLRNYESLVTRIKLLSELKINVRSEPQDGRFTVGVGGKDIEMRVSAIPSEFGETVVMRILDPDAININLSELGLREDDLRIVERELLKPNGLILNTGPTGSGKTTTLYAFLRHVNNPEIKIITVEDPIEYHLDGVEQTQVDPDTDYTFASGLRSILRQDPDVILVGEVRDKETAEIAMQAALTGHLVFSTLHTNDAVGAVPRLNDLGIKGPTIGSALTLIIAQRLVRKLCQKCKKQIEFSKDWKIKVDKFLAKLPKRVGRSNYKNPALFSPVGCAACSNVGYRGRIGIFEFLEMTSEVQEVINKGISELTLQGLANDQDMVTMQEDGILKTLLGETTFEEVEKATGPILW